MKLIERTMSSRNTRAYVGYIHVKNEVTPTYIAVIFLFNRIGEISVLR
jgi:hypothetical protein